MKQSHRPNIVLISDDQHRYDFMEMWNRFPVRTPNLARLAVEGVWHRQAYSVCPLCMPARCSMVNGLYAHQNGLSQNINHWPMGISTMPQALQQAGYHTAAVGKLHVFEAVPENLDLTTVRDEVMSLGFDDLHEVGGKQLALECDCEYTHYLKRKGLLEKYRADLRSRAGGNDNHPSPLNIEDYFDVYIGDHIVDWLDGYADDKPFFLWAGLVSPHPPFDAPEELLAHYPAEEQPLAIDNPEPEKWAKRRALYAAMVEMVDIQVGRILEALERKGILDDTLVIFVADHGEMLGDHEKAGKCFPHDPSTRVPLLARYPGVIPAGTVSDALVEITDVTATCIEAATGSADIEQFLPGSPAKSLMSHWQQPDECHREFVYSEDGGQFHPPYQMIRTDRWKYSLFIKDGRELLFDMQNDPDECTNLADDPSLRQIKDDLKSKLLARLADTLPPLRD